MNLLVYNIRKFSGRCNLEMVSGDEYRIPDSSFEASTYKEDVGKGYSGPSESRLNNFKSPNGLCVYFVFNKQLIHGEINQICML